jgi:circadian clock protein KaiC
MTAERTTSGVLGLDERIGGGLPRGRTTVVSGPVGTGKTTLAVQFLLEGAARGEPGMLLSVDEKPEHVVQDAASLGWDLPAQTSSGALTLLDASPFFAAARGREGPDARQVAADLAREVKRTHARRLAVDTLSSLVAAAAPERLHDFLRSLFFSLEDNLGCTILMTCSNGAAAIESAATALAERLAAGVIELSVVRQGRASRRTLRLLKMRGAAVQPFDVPFTLGRPLGLAVAGGEPK